ncbi:transporter substrate-binding domain-containing protein [Desulfobacterales bacterium HSG16]|nr:transporter substrate-binding domain-containing protein [Desulfobacterales bacterium HSG16]
MKKITVIVFMLAAHILTDGFACDLTVRVPDRGSYPPFFIQNENNGKWSGLSIELVEALLKEAGCTPSYKPLPFKRALLYLGTGEIDIVLNLSIKKEREKYTNFIGPQLDETVVLVVRKDSNYELNSLDDIKKLPKAIGIEKGKYYGKAFKDKRKNDKEFDKRIDGTDNFIFNERKLRKKHISGFLGYGYNVFARFKKNPMYKNFKVHSLVVQKDWVYFGLSKKSVSGDMLQKLQKAYDRATKKGTFKEVQNRYRVD